MDESITPRPFAQTGYKPPVAPDPRNFVLEKAQPVAPFPTSYKTDLTMLGVYNQYHISDCVENALTKAKEYHEYQATGAVVSLCRRFLAYFTVKDDGFPISDGTSVENAIKRLKNTGICETSFFPDDHSLDDVTFSTTPPPQAAIDNAATHKIVSYAFLSDRSAQGLKNAIYQNGIVIVGLMLDKNWWTAPNGNISWQPQDILPLRLPLDKASQSGHAVILYAYDEDYFYVWNSFGDQWGIKGHGYFGPEYVPYIYEAATILDLTADQIAALKNEVNQAQVIVNSKPSNTILNLIKQILQAIQSFFI